VVARGQHQAAVEDHVRRDRREESAALACPGRYAGGRGRVLPELNVLCRIADLSGQSEQPVTKHLVVEATPAA
jgi:hypothetical protein